MWLRATAKITALGKTIDERFAKVDEHFANVDQQFVKVDQRFAGADQKFVTIDQQFADMKAHLGIKIEAVDDRVRLVYDVLIAQPYTAANKLAHTGFTERLDDHDVRILALEPLKPAGR